MQNSNNFNLQGLGADAFNQLGNQNAQQQQLPGQFRRAGGFGGNRRGRQDAEYVPRVRHRGQRPVDIYSSIIAYLDKKKHNATNNPFTFHVPPHEYYCKDVLPSFATPFNASTALCTQWAHTSQYPDTKMNAVVGGRPRAFFTQMKWSATGRKLLCATNTGEFVLWNGAAFTAEMKTVAHKSRTAVRALAWGKKSGIIISGDEAGTICLWTQHFSQAAEITGNQRAIRDVCFGPSELRFCTGGQDGTCGIWDIERLGQGGRNRSKNNNNNKNNRISNNIGVEDEDDENQQHQNQPGSKKPKQPNGGDDDFDQNKSDDDNDSNSSYSSYSDDDDDDEENEHGNILTNNNDPDIKLSGHGGDVLTVRWHPYQCVIATGSQDKDIRLWDPRSSDASIATLQGHGDLVSQVRWHELGRSSWLLSGSRDGTARLWDIRNTRQEVTVYSGHSRAINGLEWHPTHPDLFVSGGHDGLVAFWIVNANEGNLRSNGITYEVSKFAAGIDAAHEKWKNEANPVLSLAWSPMGGHVLATGGAELHIWTRNRPGAIEEMRFEAPPRDGNSQTGEANQTHHLPRT